MRHLLYDVDFVNLDMESVLANSYKDFHAKGLDYLCLHRSPGLTVKAYIFAGDAHDASEVVNPHNHRYHFTTQCFSGQIRNKWYRNFIGHEVLWPNAERYSEFAWNTPLNGGDGFTYVSDMMLAATQWTDFNPGEVYAMSAYEFHTIQVMEPDTVIVLHQYEDVVHPGVPTKTFTQSPEPPDLSGLYNTFTADQAVKRINLLQELAEELEWKA